MGVLANGLFILDLCVRSVSSRIVPLQSHHIWKVMEDIFEGNYEKIMGVQKGYDLSEC